MPRAQRIYMATLARLGLAAERSDRSESAAPHSFFADRRQAEVLMSAQSDNYIAKRLAFNEVQRERDALIAFLVSTIGEMNQRPETFHFANTPGALPPEVTMSRNPPIDGNRWPGAEQVQSQFVKWHEAKRELMEAWRGVPEAERSVLQPPPSDD